ncbi:M16 family metallopeptidase [Streptomyces sp. NBC_00212]|uniref:M16 family metallopeptidase n=1 Tax=Streptomyces sp. NBC_00212 TaxID=2975684 RepID=UPI00324C2574
MTVIGLPPLGPVPDLSLPPLADVTLPSGLRVVAARCPSVPMTELRLAVPLPVVTANEAAVAEVLAASMLHGYANRTHADIADLLERSGSTLDVGRSRWLTLSASCPTDRLEELVHLIGGLMAGAAHCEDAVDRERRRLTQKVTVARAQPQTIAASALVDHAYGDVPALRPLPELADVARVTAERVRELHRRTVLPGGAHLVIVGDIDLEDAIETVARQMEQWEAGSADGPQAFLRPLPAGSLRLVDRPGAVQSQIRLLAPGAHRDDPRFPSLSLANVVFGGYFSSRLVMSLREEFGLAYRVDSSFRDYLDQMVIAIEADTATEVTAAALKQIQHQIRQLSERPVTGVEIDAARRYLAGMSMLATASQSGLAGSLLAALLLGQPPARLVTFPKLLDAIDTEELRATASEFYRPEAFCGVVVGDRSALADELEGTTDDYFA